MRYPYQKISHKDNPQVYLEVIESNQNGDVVLKCIQCCKEIMTTNELNMLTCSCGALYLGPTKSPTVF